MEKEQARHSVHRRAEYERLRKKTKEHEFITTLRKDYELSPQESRGIFEVVQATFLDHREKHSGQTEYVAVGADEGSGKPIDQMRKVRIILTSELGSDHDVQERLGDSAMRKVQILRLLEEAYDQGALLTQEDLGRLLQVSSRTIRRDVADLMKQNVKLYLRGLQCDIGKGISHKVRIVQLYLQGKTYSEIERISGHSLGAIKIYINDFSRVLLAMERGIKNANEIGFYIGRTERLVKEYLELIDTAATDVQQQEQMTRIKEQMSHFGSGKSSKKSHYTMVWRFA
jgi:hypothetical protein